MPCSKMRILANNSGDLRTHRATPELFARVRIFEQGIADYEHGKASVPEDVKPHRTLRTANQARRPKHPWKRQDPRDQDNCREEVSARDHEDGAHAQDVELGE